MWTQGQRFDKKGKKIGKEFVAGDLDSAQAPFVGTLGDGRFMAGFRDFLAADILATIFDPRDEVIKRTKAADLITSRVDGAEVIGKKGKDILLGQKDKDVLQRCALQEFNGAPSAQGGTPKLEARSGGTKGRLHRWRRRMKRFVLPIAATALSFGLAGAFAAETMIISDTDMPKLMEWVKTQNKMSISAPSGFSLSIGAVLPDTVTMYEFPASVGIQDVTKYRYVLIDGKTVLVDPADRKVVQIIG